MPKSKHRIPGRLRSTYEFIKAHQDRHSVQMMSAPMTSATAAIESLQRYEKRCPGASS